MPSTLANNLGWWVLVVPVVGGVIVGFMARYGSKAIRGHGIPEAMERVLQNQSRIAPRLMFLKPLSAAVAIGTGGPFGAEGPIIATGGAMGSVLGQIISTTASDAERRCLWRAARRRGWRRRLARRCSAVLLAVELLLFGVSPAVVYSGGSGQHDTAAAIRFAFGDKYPVFDMPLLHNPTGPAMLTYFAIGIIIGIVSVGVTRSVYWVEVTCLKSCRFTGCGGFWRSCALAGGIDRLFSTGGAGSWIR